MESYVPSRLLRDRIVSIQRVVSGGHASRVLPSAGAVLGLQVAGRILGPEGPLSSLGVTGIMDAARRYTYDGPTETFLIRFRPQGATCLGLPANHLSGRSLSLSDVWERPGRERAARLLEALHATPTARARIRLLEEFLLTLPYRRDMRLERALLLLDPGKRQDQPACIATVARDLGLSSRQLERLFLERIGLSPKRYMRLRRFEHALSLTRLEHPAREVAFAAGYADQAHFIREFRNFCGTTPRRFAQEGDFVS